MLDNTKVRFRSVVKPNEDSKYREDRIKIGPNFFALADGAGGQGVYAAEWAEYLLDNIPFAPIKTPVEFTIWHNSIKDAFYNNKLAEIKHSIPDLQNKFEREGSLSTLLVMWYIPDENKTYLLSCGDSALFLKTKRFWSSISYPDFMNNPHLVSCIDSYPQEKVIVRSDLFYKTGSYLLCSDTIAQYILAAYLFTNPTIENKEQLKMVEDDYVRLSQYTIDLRKSGIEQKDFQKDIIKTLRRALYSEKDFKFYTSHLHSQKLLGYDDYSLIMIN